VRAICALSGDSKGDPAAARLLIPGRFSQGLSPSPAEDFDGKGLRLQALIRPVSGGVVATDFKNSCQTGSVEWSYGKQKQMHNKFLY